MNMSLDSTNPAAATEDLGDQAAWTSTAEPTAGTVAEKERLVRQVLSLQSGMTGMFAIWASLATHTHTHSYTYISGTNIHLLQPCMNVWPQSSVTVKTTKMRMKCYKRTSMASRKTWLPSHSRSA